MKRLHSIYIPYRFLLLCTTVLNDEETHADILKTLHSLLPLGGRKMLGNNEVWST